MKLYLDGVGCWKFSYRKDNEAIDLGTYAGDLKLLVFQLADKVPKGAILDVEAINNACTENSRKKEVTVRLLNPEIFCTNGMYHDPEEDPGQILCEMVHGNDIWAGSLSKGGTECIATVCRKDEAVQEAQRRAAMLKLSKEEYDAIYNGLCGSSAADYEYDPTRPWSWGERRYQ